MSRSNEIYHYDRRIDTELKKIASSNSLNKEVLLRFYEHSVAESLSIARVYKRINTMRLLSELFGKSFEHATRDELVGLVAKIERRTDLGAWARYDYKAMLKKFYRWLRNSDPGETPAEVRWIKSSNNIPSKLRKQDLLTPEEVNRIIDCASDIQDKAFFAVLFDSGRRVGEIMGLRIRDVEFDTLGAVLHVDGKIGPDASRISASAPRLATWLNNHPTKQNPDAPLWVIKIGPQGRQLTYSALNSRLRKILAKAKLKKKFWPYLLRHSRYAPTIHLLTDQEQNAVFGWKPGSKAKQAYIHLAEDDRDQAFLKMNGLSQRNTESEPSKYVPIVCSRCNASNSPDSKFCNGCGLALDLKAALEADRQKPQVKERLDTLSTELSKSPELLEMLVDAITMMKNGKYVSDSQ